MGRLERLPRGDRNCLQKRYNNDRHAAWVSHPAASGAKILLGVGERNQSTVRGKMRDP